MVAKEEVLAFEKECDDWLTRWLDKMNKRFLALLEQRTGEKWHVGYRRGGPTFTYWFLSPTDLMESVPMNITRLANRWGDWIPWADYELDCLVRKWQTRRELREKNPTRDDEYQEYIRALWEIEEQGKHWYGLEGHETARKFRESVIK
jgi:hypothetical protein